MEPYIVTYSKFFETRLIDAQNGFHNSISIKKAKDLAKDANLDLVCFNQPEGSTLALCKIIDYGKWKYQQEKAKKKEYNNKPDVKELRFAPVISENDLSYKVDQIIDFIKKGNEVIVVMRFKGIHHRLVEDGERIVNQIVDRCKDVGKEISRKKTPDNIYIRLTKI